MSHTLMNSSQKTGKLLYYITRSIFSLSHITLYCHHDLVDGHRCLKQKCGDISDFNINRQNDFLCLLQLVFIFLVDWLTEEESLALRYWLYCFYWLNCFADWLIYWFTNLLYCLMTVFFPTLMQVFCLRPFEIVERQTQMKRKRKHRSKTQDWVLGLRSALFGSETLALLGRTEPVCRRDWAIRRLSPETKSAVALGLDTWSILYCLMAICSAFHLRYRTVTLQPILIIIIIIIIYYVQYSLKAAHFSPVAIRLPYIPALRLLYMR